MALLKLKKGEILFNEGEASRSMYFIQKGTLRLFKRKANTSIELGILHKGEVVGEMGFLDGGPRSASVEAIHETELVEITNDKLQDQFKVLPPWLIVLLKTIVNRLRSANTKIKQLESSTNQITYGRDGPMQTYVFLPVHDVLKILSALLLVAARNGQVSENGSIKVKPGLLQRYITQMFSIQMAKMTEVLDLLERVGILKMEKIPDPKGERTELYLSDIGLLESIITFINDENLKENSKKISFSAKGVKVLSLIAKYLDKFPAGDDGIANVNMAQIIEAEKALNEGKEPFLQEEFNELVKNHVATELAVRDSTTMLTRVHAVNFLQMHKMQLFIREIECVNENKRRNVA